MLAGLLRLTLKITVSHPLSGDLALEVGDTSENKLACA